ncbi:MAG: LTA synthase family protein, partial [Burkholderiales bacterium]
VRPTPAAIAIHTGIFSIVFLVSAVIWQRPFLAAGLALALQLLVIVVSEAKRRALREPLVFSDFGLFSQALRHPRLYLPYLQPLPVLAAALAFAVALAAGFALDVPGLAWDAWLVLLLFSIGLVWRGSRVAGPCITLEPERDIAHLGLLASCWLYWLAERKPVEEIAAPALAIRALPVKLPDVVAVECESFFDARRLHDGVPGDVLRQFDTLCSQGESGQLTVPAWGAYTMRTEFAFLSGIPSARLGVHRFNPYRCFARRRIPTIASRLRALGYRTVCIHPYPASFFGRDRVFPNLGFDEFVDLSSFADAPRDGPYVADAAVARKIGETLRGSNRPVFVFAITMENHGPLHLEAGAGGDGLAIYLRHLRNADAMIGELADTLRSLGGDSVLCVFGDHVPSMPVVFSASRFEDPRTEYLVWRPGGTTGTRNDLRVEDLGELVLRTAGLAG